MKTVSISGSPRENVGKKDAKILRRSQLVPCVLYGGEKQYHFSIPEKSFGPIIYSPYTFVIDLSVEGKTFKTVLQEVQYHPVKDNILHVDFLEIKEDKPVVINLPVRISGTSPGVLRGGKLVNKYRKLKVRGIVSKLPELIDISINNLEVGDAIKVADIKIDGVDLLESPRNIVVTVQSARNMITEEPAKK
ncbi:MAG: 50S ribosomal protein L25/general stress protein Ctc [Bacteroidota bacterium]